jgi:DNA-binding transcriptional ArsR family regulator
MADRHRAHILLTLLGGTPQSGSALAEEAGISRALASAHLKKLVAGGLVGAQRSGRQQLYSLASAPVAEALETLILLAPAGPVRSLRDSSRAKSLRWARMCYDHLAGVVGVAVAEGLTDRDLIREHDGGYVLAPRADAGFREFGIDIGELRQRTRPVVRPCVDWSERRNHLAGSLGAAVTATMMRQDWLRRRERTRIVTVTETGEAGLRDWLGLELSELRTAS